AGAMASAFRSVEITVPPAVPPDRVSAPVTHCHCPATFVWYLKDTWYEWPAVNGTVAGTVRYTRPVFSSCAFSEWFPFSTSSTAWPFSVPELYGLYVFFQDFCEYGAWRSLMLVRGSVDPPA